MKQLILCMLAFALIMSCEQNEEPSPNELSSPESESISNGLNKLQDLFALDISNGLLYAEDNLGQVIALKDGNPVCHADYPTEAFRKVQIKSNAQSGIYISEDRSQVGFFEGNLSDIAKLHQNCVTRRVVVPRDDCPPGTYLGAIIYTIEECYVGYVGSPFVTKRDTIGVRHIPCVRIDIEIPKLEPIYWELPDGTKIDPWCLFPSDIII